MRRKVPEFWQSNFSQVLIAGLFLTLLLLSGNLNMFAVKSGLILGDYRLWLQPLAVFFSRSVQFGHLPLWCSQIGCGFPIFAEGQIAALYPLNFLFYSWHSLPFQTAYNLFMLFQYWLAGMLFYFYCRHLKLSLPGALAGTAIFMWGSFQGGFFCNANSQKILTWFPLVLWLLDKFFLEKRLVYFLWIGLIVGVWVNSGHPQTALYAGVFTFIYFCVKYVWRPEFKAMKISEKISSALLPAVTAGSVALLVALPQILATRELVQASNRLQLPESFAYVGSLAPQAFLLGFFPFLSPYLGSDFIYTGIFGIFLILLAWSGRKSWPREMWILFWVGLVALLVGLGKFDPLYVAFIKLTRFYSIRVPARITYFSGFALAVFAGWGWDWLWGGEKGEPFRRVVKLFLVIMAASVLIGVFSHAAITWGMPYFQRWGEWIIRKHYAGNALHPYSVQAYQQRLLGFLIAFQSALSWKNAKMFQWLGLFFLNGLLVWRIWKSNGRHKKAFMLLSGLLLLADLFLFNTMGSFRAASGEFKSQSVVSAPFIEEIKKVPGEGRLFEYCTDLSQREGFPLFFNSGLAESIPDVGIYSPLALSAHREFFMGLGANDNSLFLSVVDSKQFPRLKPLLDLAHVRFILGKQVPEDNLEKRFQSGGFTLYENKQVLPEAFWMPEASVHEVSDFNTYVRMRGFNPRGEMVFENTNANMTWQPPQQSASDFKAVEILKSGDEDMKVFAEFNTPGWLVISHLYYPGWKVLINGRPGEIRKADGIFQAIALPAGKCLVEVFYEPVFKKILWLPWAVLILVAFLALVEAFFYFGKKARREMAAL